MPSTGVQHIVLIRGEDNIPIVGKISAVGGKQIPAQTFYGCTTISSSRDSESTRSPCGDYCALVPVTDKFITTR
ncbi:unnamed protein product [Allacma fusca]|uniref:Uncharacterized protein n=1 Tax=Allacma fusca TaxID=39272 RepID=A0A8J2PQF3_9HEXA|nr:unnamed protein product [Allacma fusca]